LLDRSLATLVELEQNCISPFVILTFCSSKFVEFLIGYSPPLAILGLFREETNYLGLQGKSSCLGVSVRPIMVVVMVLCPRRGTGCMVLHSAGCGGNVGTLVVRQLSCATWYRRCLCHCLLVSRGCRTGGSRFEVVSCLIGREANDHDPELWGRGLRWLGWPWKSRP
jgi:hypothetical protein